MARPLRIEFQNALYYVTSAGNGGNPIFRDPEDGNDWLEVFASVCKRFNWQCLSYCLMSDRYHLIIRTPDANLSKGMRQLNGSYTQNYNRRHNTGGHVFQGRYKSVIVQEEKFLLPLIKYNFLLPMYAGFVKHPSQFKWCSCKYLFSEMDSPSWLENIWFERIFKSDIYKLDEYLFDDKEQEVIKKIKKQIYLGDDEFIASIQNKIEKIKGLEEIPNKQLTKPISIVMKGYIEQSGNQSEAAARTYLTGNYTLKEIGKFLGVHYSTVSKMVSDYESGILSS